MVIQPKPSHRFTLVRPREFRVLLLALLFVRVCVQCEYTFSCVCVWLPSPALALAAASG